MSHVQICPNDPPIGTLLTVPYDAPSLSRTVPHDGPMAQGTPMMVQVTVASKALAGAGRGNLHIRQQAHSTQYTTNHMQHGQGPAQDPAFTFLLTCINSWTKLADIRDSSGTKAGNDKILLGC